MPLHSTSKGCENQVFGDTLEINFETLNKVVESLLALN